MKKLLLPAVVIVVLAAGAATYFRHQNGNALPDNIAVSNGRLELERYGDRVFRLMSGSD